MSFLLTEQMFGRAVNKVILFILFSISICSRNAQESFIDLPQGRTVGIKTFIKSAISPIEIYYGIPYASAPKGILRFANPERHPGWRRTLYAHRQPPRCPQAGIEDNDINEDCLFLNIWTPGRVDANQHPVVVIIYSESWTEGPKTFLPCEELAAEGVVVVTVAFRINYLGFFNLNTISARGNLGILDQYMAILWVYNNIGYFGGDHTAITLLGHSAGADSILHHLASQRSLGLFQRAIIMSPLEVRKIIYGESNDKSIEHSVKNMSLNFANDLGCISTDYEDILTCLKNKPLEEILKIYERNANSSQSLQPTSESFLAEADVYLQKPLTDELSSIGIIKDIKVDLLIGNTDLEVISNHEYYEAMTKHQYSENFLKSSVIPELLKYLKLPSNQLMVEAVYWEYWKSRCFSEHNQICMMEQTARAKTCVHWNTMVALLAARLARKLTKVYVYQYAVSDGINLDGNSFNLTGAPHGNDLVMLLGESMMRQIARRTFTASEEKSSQIYRNNIVNFIKYGSPAFNSEWPPYRSEEPYIHIINGKCCETNHAHDVSFWLQYLTQLPFSADSTFNLPLEQGEHRLRGGVFALSGVTLILLLLLFVSSLVLRRERNHRQRSFSSNLDNLSE